MRAIGGRAAAIVAAFVLASTAACTDEDPTPPPPTTSSSTPTSPTPTSSSPAPQPESAEDFIRRWVEEHRKMQNTGETSEFLGLSRNCAACRELATTVANFYSAGGYVKTDGWRILSIKREGSQGRHEVFRVRVRSAPTEYQESANGDIRRLAGGITDQRIDLARLGDTWSVSDLSQYAS